MDTTLTYIHVSRKLQVSTYYILHELGVTLTYELRVTIYCTSYELIFTYKSQVSNY